MNNNERFGKAWYQPANCYTFFDGDNFLDKNGLVLIHPDKYPYEDGGFTL
jgi:hypothetical protein